MQTANKRKGTMTNEENSSHTGSKGSGKQRSPLSPAHPASHLDALHRLVDGLEQGPVLRVLVAVFIGKHVGEGFHVGVEVLL